MVGVVRFGERSGLVAIGMGRLLAKEEEDAWDAPWFL